MDDYKVKNFLKIGVELKHKFTIGATRGAGGTYLPTFFLKICIS